MSKTFKFAAAAVAVAGALASNAYAGGFQLTEQSALGLGRAYAGVGVDGKDVSGIWYNSATMTLLQGTQAQAGLIGVGLNLDWAGADGETENGRHKPEVVPNAFISHQINDSVWFGMGITAPFGMAVQYDDNWNQNEKGISSSIQVIDLNPNMAFKLNDKLSFGVGASLQYAHAKLKKAEAIQGATIQKLAGELDAESWAWGYNLGVMWTPIDTVRLGLSYRSKIKHDAKGDYTVEALQGNLSDDAYKQALEELSKMPYGALLGTFSNGSATVNAPASAILSAAWDATDVLSLYSTIRWTDWSSFDQLDIYGGRRPAPTHIQNEWRDTWLYSVGADLAVTDWWTLRGGIAYERSPISTKKYRTAIIPDADRWWFSVGSTFHVTKNFQTDVSFAHLHGVHERSLYTEDGSSSLGKFRKLDAFLLGVQGVYRF